MAVIPAKMVVGEDGTVTVTWPALNAGDSGSLVDLAAYPIKSVQFYGTFGGTTMTFEGSNDPTGAQKFGLKDYSNTVISTTSAGGFSVRENTRFVRPLATGGAAAAVTVVVIAAQKG